MIKNGCKINYSYYSFIHFAFLSKGCLISTSIWIDQQFHIVEFELFSKILNDVNIIRRAGFNTAHTVCSPQIYKQ